MILNIDCRHGLAMLPDNSVDAILTDPPYEIGMMGHAWDRSGIAFDVSLWREALRVLKPGGHMQAFSASRTYHRMTCAIEDAGFEIRDMMQWVYGSGFPKSLDISKALDAYYGAQRPKIGEQFRANTGRNEDYKFKESVDITGPATLAAQLWEGWGTALKPSHEPICIARKPLAGATVAANILQHGVGGLNINACRVAVDPLADASQLRTMNVSQHDGADGWGMNTGGAREGARVLGLDGRWPANFVHDGSPEVLARFPETTRGGGPVPGTPRTQGATYGKPTVSEAQAYGSNTGSAARFFQRCEWAQDDLDAALFHYCAKASKREKGADNNHPTVKPVALGRYLARLICPPGGTVLDLFTGSGSFAVAAKAEGFNFIGFEQCPESTELALRRYSVSQRAVA